MRKYIFLFLILFVSVFVFVDAQNKEKKKSSSKERVKKELKKSEAKTGKARLDSLLTEYYKWIAGKSGTAGTEFIPKINDNRYIKLLNELSYEYFNSDSLKNIQLAEAAYDAAISMGNQKEAGIALNNLGNHFNNYNDFDKSGNFYNRAFKVFEEIGDNEWMGIMTSNLGWRDTKMGNYSQALEKYDKALDYYDLAKAPLRRYNNTLRNKISALKALNRRDDVIKQYEKLLALAKENGNANMYFETLNNMAAYYSDSDQKNKALAIMKKSYEFVLEKGLKSEELLALTNLASIYTQNEIIDEAYNYNQKALNLAKELGDFSLQSIILRNLGLLNLNSKKYNEADSLFKESLKLADKRNSSEYIHLINLIGLGYWNVSEAKKALEYLKMAEDFINPQMNEHTDKLNMLYFNISLIHSYLGQYDKSLDYALKNLKLAEDRGDSSSIALSYSSIAGIYYSLKEYDKSNGYFEESIKIHKKYNNYARLAHSNYNLAVNHQAIGNSSKAEELFSESLKYAQLSNDRSSITAINSMLADIEINKAEKKNYQKAIELRLKNIEFYDSINDKNSKAWEYYKIGYYYHEQYLDTDTNDTLLSQKYLNLGFDYKLKALEIYKEINSNSKVLSLLQEISSVYSEMKDDKKALEYYKEYAALKDSLNNIENRKALADLKSRRELEVKEKENEVLKQKSEIQELELSRQSQNLLLLKSREELQRLALDNKNNELELLEKDKSLQELELNKNKIEAEKRAEQLKLKDIEVTRARNEQLALFGGIASLLLIIFFVVRERKKSENLLLNILPKSIAERLKRREKLIADYFETASVIFIDQVSFTEKSRNLNPAEIVSKLNEIYTEFDKLADKYGLEKIKTIGDCYMAACGIPESRADHAEATARFAMEAIKVEIDGISFRCGIDCGPVVAGVIGKKKFIYDLWGDTVNTASRMEEYGESGKIQVTERFKNKLTQDGIGDQFVFEERDAIEIKGKGKMKTWLLKITN